MDEHILLLNQLPNGLRYPLVGGSGHQAGVMQIQIPEDDVAPLLAARLDPHEPAYLDTGRK